MENIKNLIKSYEKWVADNPQVVCDLETTTKWISYFIAGRITDSNVVSELVYSLSNIMVFYNDRIIEKSRTKNDNSSKSSFNMLSGGGLYDAATISTTTTTTTSGGNKIEQICYRLKVVLTTLEYCEVFIEISAKRFFGTKGKWIFVAILQMFKAAGRFFLLKHSMEQIITSPAIPNVNRRVLIKQDNKNANKNKNFTTSATTTLMNKNTDAGSAESSNFTFRLKRSGRLIRKVEGAPPLQYRELKFNNGLIDANHNKTTIIPSSLLQAEYIYIAKPLIHLAAMGIFGEKRWKQYMTSLLLDLYSIHLYHKNRHLMTKQQKLELSRRCINLLMYLMRSPMYDEFTKSRLDKILGFLATSVPIVKLIAGPLRDYIPHWQNTYFYLWST